MRPRSCKVIGNKINWLLHLKAVENMLALTYIVIIIYYQTWFSLLFV